MPSASLVSTGKFIYLIPRTKKKVMLFQVHCLTWLLEKLLQILIQPPVPSRYSCYYEFAYRIFGLSFTTALIVDVIYLKSKPTLLKWLN